MQTQITRQCVIEEETKKLGKKPLCRPPSGNRSTRQFSWDTWVSKRPSKPNLPSVPKPSKLLLQQGFSELCLVQLSGSCNKLHVAFGILGFFQCFPAALNDHLTLSKGVVSVKLLFTTICFVGFYSVPNLIVIIFNLLYPVCIVGFHCKGCVIERVV